MESDYVRPIPLKPQMLCLSLLDEVSRALRCKKLEGLGWQRLIYVGTTATISTSI